MWFVFWGACTKPPVFLKSFSCLNVWNVLMSGRDHVHFCTSLNENILQSLFIILGTASPKYSHAKNIKLVIQRMVQISSSLLIFRKDFSCRSWYQYYYFRSSKTKRLYCRFHRQALDLIDRQALLSTFHFLVYSKQEANHENGKLSFMYIALNPPFSLSVSSTKMPLCFDMFILIHSFILILFSFQAFYKGSFF